MNVSFPGQLLGFLVHIQLSTQGPEQWTLYKNKIKNLAPAFGMKLILSQIHIEIQWIQAGVIPFTTPKCWLIDIRAEINHVFL